MQPPPRKGNYAKFLKNLHSEQIAKLQAKNQHECDLLEDVRQFTVKRSAIEKSYSDALLKISSAYLNKKIPNIPDIKMDGSEEKWNMWSVWRTVLEENEKLARARLAAVEVFQQQIADEAKALRAHKMQISKKTVDYLVNVQKELQASVQDVDKTKKLYFDEEHSAHDVRDKAKDIEEKLKKKKGSFFQSITSLQKNSARVSSRRDALEEKSSGARNDYLLSLAAANAHQNRYFAIDLQTAMTTMEDYVFERVAEYLALMGRTELLTCSATQHSFGKIRDQAQQLTREYNIQCCHLYYPVLKQHIQYDFEPCDSDPVNYVTIEHDSAAQTLSTEAKRWATRIVKENNCIREYARKLQNCAALRDSGQKVDANDPNGPDLETKMDELRHGIRKSETNRAKAEARIECLRAGGVNVDEWIQEVESLSVQEIPRSASSLSVRTDASGAGENPSSDSFYDSDCAEPERETPAPPEEITQDESISESQHDAEVDAMLEQERQRIEQLTAGWDDPTQVDWGAEESEPRNETPAPSGPTFKCTALYSYTAQNPDELSIVENEQLEVVGEGDGDGWLRARNYRGEEGFVPHNYLDVERDEPVQPSSQLVTQISFSSVDYTIDDPDVYQESTAQSPDQVSVISAPAMKQKPSQMYCCALYDYDASAPDELTFEEGDVILIINKSAHGVDDGWWEGELNGARGNFPSLVVEECDQNGEPLTDAFDETPPMSAPPLCTPPAAPPSGFLFAQMDVVITQPTPCGDVPGVEQAGTTDKSQKQSEPAQGFAMELTKGQQSQYGTQFSDPSEQVNIPFVIVDEEVVQEKVKKDKVKKSDDDFGLGVAQIVITCATPMIEEPEKSFPPPEEEEEEPVKTAPEISIESEELHQIAEEEEEEEEPEPEEPEEPSVTDDQPTDSAPFPVSSSSASEGDSTGPSTAENSQSHSVPTDKSNKGIELVENPLEEQVDLDDEVIEPPKQVVGGRASIPDELAPHQLARLQGLKESNA